MTKYAAIAAAARETVAAVLASHPRWAAAHLARASALRIAAGVAR